MSLRTTWTSANRVVTQALHTTYGRTLLGSTGEMYWLYTRRRVKEYEYIGMTMATAILCAKSMNALYNRLILAQEWYNGGSAAPNPNSCWRFVTGASATDRSYNPTNVFTNNVTERLICGNARPVREQGDAWKVVVNVDERLSYNYRPIQSIDSGAPLPWSVFEGDTEAAHLEFYGAITAENENYDTAVNGYGSPT